MRLAYRFLNEPVEIQINPEKIITERIDQKIVHLGREEKIPYMTNLIINSKEEGQGIIFTNYKANIPKIVYTLRKYGVPVTGISSELDQKKDLDFSEILNPENTDTWSQPTSLPEELT